MQVITEDKIKEIIALLSKESTEQTTLLNACIFTLEMLRSCFEESGKNIEKEKRPKLSTQEIIDKFVTPSSHRKIRFLGY